MNSRRSDDYKGSHIIFVVLNKLLYFVLSVFVLMVLCCMSEMHVPLSDSHVSLKTYSETLVRGQAQD